MSDSQTKEQDFSTIISISGKPGLYKVLTQTKTGLVVESVIDGKRVPVYATDKVSALEDISIYTETEDLPLKEVFQKMLKKEGGKESLSHKSPPQELRDHFATIIEDFDQDRVYNSDVKKIFQWYNILVKSNLLQAEKPAKKEPAKKDEKKSTDEKPKKATAKSGTTAKKKAPAKKPAAKKTTTKKKD